jgi:hypothetical protein
MRTAAMTKRRQSQHSASVVHPTASPAETWIAQELAGSEFRNDRLNKRFRKVFELLSDGPGESIPLICQDWANTKASYRFLSSRRVTEAEIMAGHFQSTPERFAATEEVYTQTRRLRRSITCESCKSRPKRANGALLLSPTWTAEMPTSTHKSTTEVLECPGFLRSRASLRANLDSGGIIRFGRHSSQWRKLRCNVREESRPPHEWQAENPLNQGKGEAAH